MSESQNDNLSKPMTRQERFNATVDNRSQQAQPPQPKPKPKRNNSDNKKIKKTLIEQLSKNMVAIILLIAIVIFVILSSISLLVNDSELKWNDLSAILINFFGVSVVMLIIYFANKIIDLNNKQLKIFQILTTIVTFIIGLSFFMMINKSGFVLDADSWDIQKSIESNFFTNGQTTDAWNAQYFQTYPYQLGIAYLFLGLYKIFANNYILIFFFLNVLSLTIITYTSISISKKIFNNKAAFWAGVLSTIFIPMYYEIGLFYGDVVGTALALVSANILFGIIESNQNNKWKYILFIVVSVVSYLIKPSMNLYVMTILVFGIVYFLRTKKYQILVLGLSIFISAGLINSLLSTYQNNNYNPQKVVNTEMPKTMFLAMGLQSGGYNYKEQNIDFVTQAKTLNDNDVKPGFWNGFTFQSPFAPDDHNLTTQEMSKLASESIRKSISAFVKNPQYAFNFFARKLNYMWNDLGVVKWDGNSEWIIYANMDRQVPDKVEAWYKNITDTRGSIVGILSQFAKTIQLAIYILSLIAIISMIKRLRNLNALILILFAIAGFVFYLVSEVQTRYAIPFLVFMYPLASLGASILINKKAIN